MNDAFLKACRGEPHDHIPVWFMRQAGRSLPGYRKLRETYGVLQLTMTPELAAQVSLEPVTRLAVDAAILFADIMLLPIAMGVDVSIVDSVGPVIDDPIASLKDIAALKPFTPDNASYLQETITILRHELTVPLIGFSAAPFTLASYLIEGEPSRLWLKTKTFMMNQPAAWHQLMDRLSDAIIEYLTMQINAGVQAVQLFDSWVGCLGPVDFREFVLPYIQRIITALKQFTVPSIYFSTGTTGMLQSITAIDCDVFGLDWRIDVSDALQFIGDKSLQGNLDPATLLSDDTRFIHSRADRVLEQVGGRNGFIFNFGHGVHPDTDDHKLRELVEYIHGK